MISRHGNKFASTDYKFGDKVLVKIKIFDKKMGGKYKTFDIVKGKNINRKETRYEVNYTDKKGKDRSDWFLVSATTSVTRTIEKICDTEKIEKIFNCNNRECNKNQ